MALLFDDAFVLSLGLIPAAIGIAVLRYRLYEIDVIIRRTLVYAGARRVPRRALPGRRVLDPGGGAVGERAVGNARRDRVDAARRSGVPAARAWIQRAVDHRFYRRRYDAARTLESFSGRLREQVDIETVSGEVLDVVRQTLQPAHVSLWLRSPEVGP